MGGACARVDALEAMQCSADLEQRMEEAESDCQRLCAEADHFRMVASSAAQAVRDLSSGTMRLDQGHALLFKARRRMGFAMMRVLLAEREANDAASTDVERRL